MVYVITSSLFDATSYSLQGQAKISWRISVEEVVNEMKTRRDAITMDPGIRTIRYAVNSMRVL